MTRSSVQQKSCEDLLRNRHGMSTYYLLYKFIKKMESKPIPKPHHWDSSKKKSLIIGTDTMLLERGRVPDVWERRTSKCDGHGLPLPTLRLLVNFEVEFKVNGVNNVTLDSCCQSLKYWPTRT